MSLMKLLPAQQGQWIALHLHKIYKKSAQQHKHVITILITRHDTVTMFQNKYVYLLWIMEKSQYDYRVERTEPEICWQSYKNCKK